MLKNTILYLMPLPKNFRQSHCIFGRGSHFCWPSPYKDRLNLFDFIQDQKNSPDRGHEVMIKERIPPSKITGIVVSDEYWYYEILAYFRKQQLIQKDAQGIETILNIPIERFFRVTQTISERLFSSPSNH